jgi:hypothetical protein
MRYICKFYYFLYAASSFALYHSQHKNSYLQFFVATHFSVQYLAFLAYGASLFTGVTWPVTLGVVWGGGGEVDPGL